MICEKKLRELNDLISHPHNPGGSVWTKEELTSLADICLENNVLMISDEIHSDLIFRHTNIYLWHRYPKKFPIKP